MAMVRAARSDWSDDNDRQRSAKRHVYDEFNREAQKSKNKTQYRHHN